MPGQILENPPSDDENYVSSEDEDFNPENSTAQHAAPSSSESETEEKPGTLKRSRSHASRNKRVKHAANDEGEDIGFENSGDEGIIREGAKEARRRKRKLKDNAKEGNGDGDVDSGGEGGFVQTRSMRAAADPTTQKKALATTQGVTVDIDALWARLSNSALLPASSHPPPSSADPATTSAADVSGEEMVTINRTYTFAGKLHTETKSVPHNSAQAQAYLATKDQRASAAKAGQPETIDEEEDKKQESRKGPDGQVLFRPLRRTSPWDPNPDGFVKGLPVPGAASAHSAAASVYKEAPLKIIDKNHLSRDATLWQRISSTITTALAASQPTSTTTMSKAIPVTAKQQQLKAQRLNVVDKSKLDWAEHVDATEGARDELDKARRDKTSYLERRDFLERVEDRDEGERARAKEKGR